MNLDNISESTCCLCRTISKRLVKSHIIARGFFQDCDTKCSLALIDETGMFKRRPNALYLNRYICNRCEHDVFTPLDNYALQIYRDKSGGAVLDDDGIQIITYDSVDRRMLRGYFASLLWRMDLGRINDIYEMRNIDIGQHFREKIQNDLLNVGGASFEYIDTCVVSLKREMCQSISVPQKMILTDGGISTNGYMLQFPFLCMFVSLDYKPHPYVNRAEPCWIQETPFSLSAKYQYQSYSYFQTEYIEWQQNVFMDCILNYNKAANRRGPRIKFS